MAIQLLRGFTFCAAHRVPASPSEAGRRLHGHTFGVQLVLRGDVDDAAGWLMDFAAITAAFRPHLDRLDHACLNDVVGLENPDTPVLERWILERLKTDLPILESVRVDILGELQFSPRPLPAEGWLGLPDRLAFSIEAAHCLPAVAPGHKCRRLHGHSYRIEVGAGDPDRLAIALRSIYDRLDHRYLNEIEGLENPTSEVIARWIWQELRAEINYLSCIVVRESPQCACIYAGEKE